MVSETDREIRSGQEVDALPVSDRSILDMIEEGKSFQDVADLLDKETLWVINRYEILRKRVINPAMRLLARKVTTDLTSVLFEGMNAENPDGSADTKNRLLTFKVFNEQCDGLLGKMMVGQILKDNPNLHAQVVQQQDGYDASVKKTTIVTEELQMRLSEIKKAEDSANMDEYTSERIDKTLTTGDTNGIETDDK